MKVQFPLRLLSGGEVASARLYPRSSFIHLEDTAFQHTRTFKECGMRLWRQSLVRHKFATPFLTAALVLTFVVLSCSQPASALPAFARKYGLRCSACHESWPMLNYFGQKFKDNGYQLMNDRDAPIWQNPSYWPVTFRMTPLWHRVSTGKVLVDTAAGTDSAITRITKSGFDLSGLDFHTGGTLEKNFSFYLLPSSDNTASFHFETVMAEDRSEEHTSELQSRQYLVCRLLL